MKKEYLKALVIDDDILTTELIREIMESAGYQCEVCQNLTSASKNLLEMDFDIYFIDLMLEGLEGINLIKKIRSKYPDSIILAITGMSASDHMQAVIQAGADHFFNKPVNATLLLERLQTIIDRITTEVPVKIDLLFKAAFVQANNPVFICDQAGNLYFANNSFLEITGLMANRVERYNLQTLRLENSQEFQKVLKRCRPGLTETITMESRFNPGKRKETWFNVIINPVTIESPDLKILFLIMLYDITRKKQMDYFILNNEEKFRSFISLSNDGMALINEKGQVIEWNESLTIITGVSMEQVYGELIWEIMSSVNLRINDKRLSDEVLKKYISNALNRGLKNEKAKQNTCEIIHSDGHIVHLQYSLFTIKVEKGFRLGMVIRDNTATVNYQNRIHEQKEKLEEAYEKMEKLARIDPLTQIANRRDVEIKLDYELTRYARHHHPLSLAIADIDDFKKFNDTYGHDMGDYILIEIARLMKDTIRAQDILGRWGGEEFILAYPETDNCGAMVITEKIRHNIEQHKFFFKEIQTHVTVTIGISEFIDGEDIDMTLKRADNALYEGKKSGKNCIVVSSGK